MASDNIQKNTYAIKHNLSDPNTTISIKETNENNPTLMNSANSNQMVREAVKNVLADFVR